jgi:tetratricopeptide (TPR) repeat protein
MMNQYKVLFVVGFLSLLNLNSCATKSEKSTKEPSQQGDAKVSADEEEAVSGPEVSAQERLVVQSLSNNPFTSKTVSISKASELATQFGQAKSKTPRQAYGAIVANRLSGRGAQDSFNEAQIIMDKSLSKTPNADLPEDVKFELALSALQTNKYGLADFFLRDLANSKNVRIKAAATNTLGVISIRLGRIPEAVAIFREVLKLDPNFEAAKLNIGFLALQGGDTKTARAMLGGGTEDWFVDSAFISIDRLSGETDKAEQRCEKVLAKQPKHKPTLINCAINAYQGQGNFKKAREYLGRALQIPGGPAAWDDRSGKLLGVIDAEEARASQLKAQKESEERKAQADKQKAAADAAAPKAEQPSPPAPPK